MEESIKSKYAVNYVDSGLPRWLIELAFVCLLIQAAINYTPVLHWMEDNAQWARAIVQAFGPLVMYFGLMRGMRPLYRPFTYWWWAMIALNVAGFCTDLLPFLPYQIGLAVAVSLMLVYLPFGMLLAVSYRGQLHLVGLWMALYILISAIAPVLWFLLGAPDSGFINATMEALTIGVIIIYAFVLRKILIAQ